MNHSSLNNQDVLVLLFDEVEFELLGVELFEEPEFDVLDEFLLEVFEVFLFELVDELFLFVDEDLEGVLGTV